MIRYCLTERQKLAPCEIGWGSIGHDGCYTCHDEPQEKNCRMLVDENIPQTCPYCQTEVTARLYPDTSNLNFLTPAEAKELMYCWIHDSQNRYGKVNKEAPLYLKLKQIAEPVLLKITYD